MKRGNPVETAETDCCDWPRKTQKTQNGAEQNKAWAIQPYSILKHTMAIRSSWVGLDLGPAANGQSSALIRLHQGAALRQSTTLSLNML
jgi:hypothetical protein